MLVNLFQIMKHYLSLPLADRIVHQRGRDGGVDLPRSRTFSHHLIVSGENEITMPNKYQCDSLSRRR
jgi:hypothetical protein